MDGRNRITLIRVPDSWRDVTDLNEAFFCFVRTFGIDSTIKLVRFLILAEDIMDLFCTHYADILFTAVIINGSLNIAICLLVKSH